MREDITRLNVEAIVNAANTTLLGGGGVDGAIHTAAGPKLLAECKTLGGCLTGSAKITKGYNLKAKYVIHTVGPVYQGGDHQEEELLRSCYTSSLQLAVDYKVKSIAFPAISTGVYNYPKKEATAVAVSAVTSFLRSVPHEIKDLIFVCFDQECFDLYKHELASACDGC